MPTTKAGFDQADWIGLNKAINGLLPENLLKPELEPMALSVVAELEPYPPPETDYQRTGFLGRSWYHQQFGLDMEIGNTASYAGYVQGPEQRDYHARRGWKTLFWVFASHVDEMVQKILSEACRTWRK